MFWHGENSRTTHGDFRPEVHDSDGLLLQRGNGEWLWRPLGNPDKLRLTSFADENPRGFGLLQRDRDFEHYQDLEAHYHLRPSVWVEPVGAWGMGAVRLVELSTPDETSDNIVACWVPARLPPPDEPLEFEYKLHWYLEGAKRPPAGYVAATRLSAVQKHPELTRFLVDFDGPYLNAQPADPAIEPVITVGEGVTLVPDTVTIQKNPHNGTWRVTFALRPDGSGRAVELRCFLRKTPHVLTETWSYLWNP
jgi:glucans biosynthesis protein